MNKKNSVNIILLLTLGYFTWLMLLICLQYIPVDFDVAFLRIKQQEIQMPHYQIGFFTHVYSSFFTLLAGITQFSSWFRKKYNSLHKLIGKIYVFIVIFLAGPSGLLIAFYAKAGFWAQLSFVILAILWMLFTFLAFRKALSQDFVAHKKYMYFSYALTLSAITLRLWKWFISNTLALPPHEIYIIVAWLAWTLNLALAFYLFKRQKHSIIR